MFQKIAVIGAGSMGTILGALLTKSGYDVILVDVNAPHIEAMQKDGAVITGILNEKIAVKACTTEDFKGEYDLIFLFTKQTANQEAFDQIEKHIHINSVICTLQNGIPEFSVAERFGADSTVGCAVTWSATFLGPGVTQANTLPEFWNTKIGRIDGKSTPELEAIRDILSSVCHTEISNNLLGMRWSKLLINSSFSGMSAVLNCTFGEVLDNPIAFSCAQHIARECIRVARAGNYSMEPLGEREDFERLLDFNTSEEREATSGLYRKLFGSSANGVASMLQDLRLGRKTEVDAINGLVSEFGRNFNVGTPVCDTVVSIIKDIENGIHSACMDNLKFFKDLLINN